jgi:hypothetical protein
LQAIVLRWWCARAQTTSGISEEFTVKRRTPMLSMIAVVGGIPLSGLTGREVALAMRATGDLCGYFISQSAGVLVSKLFSL